MLFLTPHFSDLGSTFFVLDSAFWLDSTLKIDPAFEHQRNRCNDCMRKTRLDEVQDLEMCIHFHTF